MNRWREEHGQGSVELLAIVPLVALVATGCAQLLAAGMAREAAAGAAEAGAMALLQGGDPDAAARRAAPGWSRRRMRVDVSGRVVQVRIDAPAILPGVADLLETRARADAGPAS